MAKVYLEARMLAQPRNIILVGFMASGKTSVGRALSERIGWPLLDADDVISARAGKPVHRIFSEDGEPRFREMERQVIADLCAGAGQVIAAGGGAFVDPSNRTLMLASGAVFCLNAQPETILRRLSSGEQSDDSTTDAAAVRPLLAGDDPMARVKSLLAQRACAYAHAQYTIETDGLTPEQVASRVLEAWEQ